MKTTSDNILLLSDRVLAAEPLKTPSNSEPQVWAYLGAVGGAGVTSLAVQTAYELARLNDSECSKKICLIDLDFERGACASYLDVAPSTSLADINEACGRMDADLAATFIIDYKQKFSFIGTDGILGGNDEIKAEALLSLLDSICDMFDIIVLDVPSMWRPWTQAVVGAADKLTLVTSMRVPALHQTKKMAQLMTSAMKLSEEPHILVNKFERREVPHGITLKDAQSVLGRSDFIKICIDNETLRSAINCGSPVGALYPDSRYAKDVRDHVRSWLGLDAEKKPIGAKFFRKPTRRQKRRA